MIVMEIQLKPSITDYKTWVRVTSETLNETGLVAQKTKPNELVLELANYMKMEIKLKPWQVPNFVVQETTPGKRHDGFKECPSYSLDQVSAETLAELCDEFRREIFNKAGKKDPAL